MPARHVVLAIGIAAVWGVNFVVIHVERPRRMQVVGALVALGGIAVIALGRGGNVPLGALALAIAAAASWGVGNICTRRAQADDPVALLVWSSLIPPLPLAGLS